MLLFRIPSVIITTERNLDFMHLFNTSLFHSHVHQQDISRLINGINISIILQSALISTPAKMQSIIIPKFIVKCLSFIQNRIIPYFNRSCVFLSACNIGMFLQCFHAWNVNFICAMTNYSRYPISILQGWRMQHTWNRRIDVVKIYI